MTTATEITTRHPESKSHPCASDISTSLPGPSLGQSRTAATRDGTNARDNAEVGAPGRRYVQPPLVASLPTCTASRHGTRAAYVAGCRCDEAREANRLYAAARDRRVLEAQYGAADPLSVPVDDARAEVNRLLAAGWARRRIEAATGIKRDHLSRVMGGTDRPVRRVRWATYVALRDLPDEPPLAGGTLICALGTWRRLEALVALGYPQTFLAGELGLGRALQVNRFLVTVRNAEKVVALYERLSGTPGPSERTRMIARSKGYAPPLAWDDETIDDPAALPCGVTATFDKPDADQVVVDRFLTWALTEPTGPGAKRSPRPDLTLTDPDRVEIVRALLDRDYSPSAVGVLLGRGGAYLRGLIEVAS